MRLIRSQALCRSRPLCMTCMRRWSSSLTITLNFSRAVDGHGAGALALGVLAADELPLDEELAVDALQVVDVDVEQLAGLAAMLSTHSRRIVSICARSWGVARLMKGKSARFRARRMRLLMTMSDSGPEPRSHSPLVAGQVVEFHGVTSPQVAARFRCGGSRRGVGGPLVVLVVDGFLHLAAEADQLRALLAACRPSGAAACPRAPTRRGR